MEPPRRGLTDRFARIVEAVRGLVASKALLDGEAVACGGGSDFSARLTKRGGAQASPRRRRLGFGRRVARTCGPWRRSGLGGVSVTLTPPTRVYVVLYLNHSSQLSVSDGLGRASARRTKQTSATLVCCSQAGPHAYFGFRLRR